jgi:PAS domain S-box-containing protein
LHSAHLGLGMDSGLFALLAYSVAVLAGWTSLDLYQRVSRRQGTDVAPWLSTAALAMGGGIWSMHFIAMLGHHPAGGVAYDPLLTVLSFLIAVAGTGGAFLAASRDGLGSVRIPVAGAAMGGAIALMHYVGIAAMQVEEAVSWRTDLVLLSILIAIGASVAALWVARRDPTVAWRAAAAAILGLAVVGMHYVGMAAMHIEPTAQVASHSGLPPIAIAVAVATVTSVILFLALTASLADERDRLASVLAAGGVGYWEVNVRTLTYSLSPRARELLGLEDGQSGGTVLSPLWLEDDFQPARAEAMKRALAGEAEFDMEYPVAATGRWIQSRGRLIRSRSGRPLKLAGVVTDITDRRRAFSDLETSERRQQLLINELNHRVKNTLATLQSIAVLTARRAGSVAEFSIQFEARLMALSATHNLLTATGWEQARLRDLLSKELSPFSIDQFVLDGPDIELGADQALAMGMILHELATNAAKYGALSREGGLVTVAWSVREDDHVLLDWTETGGPPVAQPLRTGFGSRLISTSVKGDLKGAAEMDYAPEGLRARLVFRPSAEATPA